MGDFIKEHKGLFFGGLIAALMLTALGVSAVSGAIFNRSETTSTDAADTERFEGEDETETARDLTKAQLDLQKSYTDKETDIAAQLAAATWIGTEEVGTLEFDEDGFYTETAVGEADEAEEVEGSVAIAGIDGAPLELVQDDSVGYTDFILLDDSGGYHIAHLQRIVPRDGENFDTYYLLSCDLFDSSYSTLHEYKELKTTGVGEEIEDALGKKAAKQIEPELVEYAKAHHPTCFEAVWDKSISFDYEANTVTIGFMMTSSTLDDQGQNDMYPVNVEYNMQSKEFTITDISE